MSENVPPSTMIDYYTDMLCVWAWIGQPRVEELQRQWGSQLAVRFRYVDIFGDSHHKIPKRWGQQDGFEKYSDHVHESAAPFNESPVHPDAWKRIRPRSSMQAHLFLKAIAITAGDGRAQQLACDFRRAFFVDSRDISQLPLLLELAAAQDLDTGAVKDCLMDGTAMAALSRDQQDAQELGLKGSPTWVLNEGRQILYGNVGYRILNANIEELLKRPGPEASWC
jgi:predicted DsbA family dithiol-disulfide isomerase